MRSGTAYNSDLGGGVALITLFLCFGWALGSSAAIVAGILGIFVAIAGIRAVLTNTVILGLMGIAGIILGIVMVYSSYVLWMDGWGF